MRHLVVIIRIVAILAGFFLLASSVATLLGVVPESNAQPTLTQRLASSAVPVMFGLVLLAPQRYVRVSPWFQILSVAHLLLAALLGVRLAQTIGLVRIGEISAIAIPVAAAFVFLPLANLAALWAVRRQSTPPNNSSKPTPLRGAA